MIRVRWLPAPRHRLRWLSQAPLTPIPELDAPAGLAAIIGPRGQRGLQGEPGIPGDGATDPGDLSLIFENHLIG